MRTLIYKRTHSGDPDPKTGVFGNNDCMGKIRAWPFDAVIGIGGVGQEPKYHGIAGRVTWVGIGPQAVDQTGRGPQLIFRHFWYLGEEGPILRTEYPALAGRMYSRNVRVLLHSPSPGERQDKKIAALDRDVGAILGLATNAAPSDGVANRRKSMGKCSVRANWVCT
jgi:hypothetical protein